MLLGEKYKSTKYNNTFDYDINNLPEETYFIHT